ncbi:MAG TPA: peptidoglycan-binding domain-containing protein [Gammaproteobacteria bacterium]|nr:peptidoglycan-binding domain-containing protein [Gammaproteobacteria bacterium]
MFRIALTRTLLLILGFTAIAPAISVAYEEKVAAVQRRLSDLDYEPGPVDGLMGPRTRNAVRAFQRANSLSPNGRLNAGTLKALFPAGSTKPKAKAVGRLLSYETLGWRAPQSGANALSRFRRKTGSLDMQRSARELVVPNGDGVYLIDSGDAVPGFDCDPGRGRIEMEFMLGPKGPVAFRPLDRNGYCQLGFGILLQVGQRLHVNAASWNGGEIPGGLVEVGTKGLLYVESSQ